MEDLAYTKVSLKDKYVKNDHRGAWALRPLVSLCPPSRREPAQNDPNNKKLRSSGVAEYAVVSELTYNT